MMKNVVLAVLMLGVASAACAANLSKEIGAPGKGGLFSRAQLAKANDIFQAHLAKDEFNGAQGVIDHIKKGKGTAVSGWVKRWEGELKAAKAAEAVSAKGVTDAVVADYKQYLQGSMSEQRIAAEQYLATVQEDKDNGTENAQKIWDALSKDERAALDRAQTAVKARETAGAAPVAGLLEAPKTVEQLQSEIGEVIFVERLRPESRSSLSEGEKQLVDKYSRVDLDQRRAELEADLAMAKTATPVGQFKAMLKDNPAKAAKAYSEMNAEQQGEISDALSQGESEILDAAMIQVGTTPGLERLRGEGSEAEASGAVAEAAGAEAEAGAAAAAPAAAAPVASPKEVSIEQFRAMSVDQQADEWNKISPENQQTLRDAMTVEEWRALQSERSGAGAF